MSWKVKQLRSKRLNPTYTLYMTSKPSCFHFLQKRERKKSYNCVTWWRCYLILCCSHFAIFKPSSFLKGSSSSSDLLLPHHMPRCTLQNMLVHPQLLRIVATARDLQSPDAWDNTGAQKRSCEAKHTNTHSWMLLIPLETYF